MLKLYFENKEVELTDDVEFTINEFFENTAKPTDRYVEFSKTISIPFSQHNNMLFGHIFEPDRIIAYDDTNNFTGIHFDPYRKIDMRLEDGDNLLLVGYAKMLSVDYEDNKGVYKVNLYGELGKVFNELSKITFDNSDTTEYKIKGEEYWAERIDRQLIYDSWNNNQSVYTLKKKTDSGYKNYNIVGWTPLNFKTDAIDQKSYENNGTTLTFQSALEGLEDPTFDEATKCAAETAIGDGLLPRDIGEFRSYLQQPFLYFNKLLPMVGAKCKELTGYSFELDSDWFNDSNPYYKDVVIALKNYEKNDEFVTNRYTMTERLMYWDVDNDNLQTSKLVTPYLDKTNEVSEIYVTDGHYFDLTKINSVAFNNKVKIEVTGKDNSRNTVRFYDIHNSNALLLNFYFQSTTDTNKIINTPPIIIIGNNSQIRGELATKYPSATIYETNGSEFKKVDKMEIEVDAKLYAPYYFEGAKLYMIGHWYDAEADPLVTNYQAQTSTTIRYVNVNIWDCPFAVNVYTESNGRSYCYKTLNDLWNADIKPFDLVMQYCKMFRIGIFAEDKKVIFKPYTYYFKNYTIENWTDKLDKSSDYSIQPITYEHKYVKFNYENNDTENNNKYSTKFGVQFGEKNINSNYVFNDETEDLFEGVKCPMENTDNILSWTNLYDRKKIEYSFPAETYVYTKDDSDGLVDNFGTFYFDKGVTAFSTEQEMYLRNVIISDDTVKQIAETNYTYNQFSDYTRTTNYHQVGITNNGYMMNYTVPMYTFTWDDYKNYQGIYELFWTNYLQERYDVQNKIVTCRLFLSSKDIADFQFNKFIIINNQLYFVNKIKDFTPNNDESTECELITIQNIEGYTTNNYDTVFSVSPSSLSMNYKGDSKTFNITSTKPIYVSTDGTGMAVIDGSSLYNSSKKLTSGQHTLSGDFNYTIDSFNLVFSGGGMKKKIPVTLVSQEMLSATLSSAECKIGSSYTLTIAGKCNYQVAIKTDEITAEQNISLSSTNGKLNASTDNITMTIGTETSLVDYYLEITTDGYYGEKITKTIPFTVIAAEELNLTLSSSTINIGGDDVTLTYSGKADFSFTINPTNAGLTASALSGTATSTPQTIKLSAREYGTANTFSLIFTTTGVYGKIIQKTMTLKSVANETLTTTVNPINILSGESTTATIKSNSNWTASMIKGAADATYPAGTTPGKFTLSKTSGSGNDTITITSAIDCASGNYALYTVTDGAKGSVKKYWDRVRITGTGSKLNIWDENDTKVSDGNYSFELDQSGCGTFLWSVESFDGTVYWKWKNEGTVQGLTINQTDSGGAVTTQTGSVVTMQIDCNNVDDRDSDTLVIWNNSVTYNLVITFRI